MFRNCLVICILIALAGVFAQASTTSIPSYSFKVDALQVTAVFDKHPVLKINDNTFVNPSGNHKAKGYEFVPAANLSTLSVWKNDDLVMIHVMKNNKTTKNLKQVKVGAKTVYVLKSSNPETWTYTYYFTVGKHKVEVSCDSETKSAPKLFTTIVNNIAEVK